MNKIAHVIDAVIQLKDNFSGTLKNVNENLSEFQKQQKYIGNDMKKRGREFEQVGSNLTKAITVPVAAMGAASLKAASNVENGMAKISTIADTTQMSLKDIEKGLIEVSNASGISIKELTEAEYSAISAGVKTADSIKFLETATKTSKAGFADMDTTIDALTTTLNAYQLEVESTMDISNQMLLAQDFGKTTVQEMGASLGNVIPIASQLNVSTKELFASIATLTRHGIKTSEAITGLRGAYTNILKPSKQASDLAKKIGLNFSASHLKSVGWAKFLDEVKEKTGGNSEQMAKLFGSIQGLNAVMVLAGKGGKDFAEVLGKMDDTAGLTDKKFEQLLTPTERLKMELNELRNVGAEFGLELIPLVEKFASVLKKVTNRLKQLTPEQKNTIVRFALIAAAVGPVIKTLGKMTTEMGFTILRINKLSKDVKKAGGMLKFFNTPGMKTIIVLTAIAAVAIIVIKYWDKLKATFNKVAKSISKSTGASEGSVKNFMKGVLVALPIVLATTRIFGGGFGSTFRILGKIVGGTTRGMIRVFGFLGRIVGRVAMGMIRAMGGFFKFMLANPIVIVIMAIIAACVLLYEAWKHNWGGIQEKTKKVIGNIKKFWKGLKEFLKHPITGTINFIQKKKAERVGKNARGTSSWRGGLTWVGEQGAELIDLPQGTRIYSNSQSMAMMKNMAPGGATLNMATHGQDMVETFADGINKNVNSVVSATTNMADRIHRLIHFSVPDEGPLSDADTYGGDMVNTLSVGVKNNTGTVVNTTTQMASRTRNVLMNFQAQCNPIGQGISNQLAAGITASSNNAVQAAQTLTDRVIEQFRQGFGIHSPSRIMFGIGVNLLQGLINGMSSKDLDKFIEAQIGSITNMFVGSSEAVTNWLAAALMATGTPLSWLPGLQSLVMAESSGNPLARNPISVGGEHATGLMQTLPSTFNANAVRGMNNILNPVHNAAAAINYIKRTYGSVYNTPLFRGGGYVGYARGTNFAAPGYHWVGEEGPELVKFRGGEKVLNHRDSLRANGTKVVITGNTFYVREESDIDKIATALVRKLEKTSFNMA